MPSSAKLMPSGRSNLYSTSFHSGAFSLPSSPSGFARSESGPAGVPGSLPISEPGAVVPVAAAPAPGSPAVAPGGVVAAAGSVLVGSGIVNLLDHHEVARG